MAGADLVFFRADAAAEVLDVREVVLLILLAAGPEVPADLEVPADPEVPVVPVDPEVPVDPVVPADPEVPVDPEATADPEVAADPEIAADPEVPADPETPAVQSALLDGFSFSSSAKDGSFSGHDLRMFS